MAIWKTFLSILGIVIGLIGGPVGKLIGIGLTLLAGTGDRRKGLDSSPRYGFDALQNAVREGGPIPVVYGQELVAPQIISTDISFDWPTQVLSILCLVGEGEIESIEDVRLNDTPITSFSGATYQTRLGTAAQTTITGFNQTGTPYEAATLLDANATHVHEMRAEADTLVLNIACLGGLYRIDSSGNQKNEDCYIKIEWKDYGALDSKYVAWGTAAAGWTSRNGGQFSFGYGSTSTVRHQFHLAFPTRGRYVVRVTGVYANETKKVRVPTLTSVVELSNDARTYASRALLAIRCPASAQLGGALPRITCRVKGRKVLNPATGLTAWTNNPVWILRDLVLAARYGLGRWIESTDLDDGVGGTWRAAASSCDALITKPDGTQEASAQFDMVLDTRAPAREWIDQVCRSARLTMFASNGKLKLARHVAGAPVRTFSEDEGDGVRKGILAAAEGDGVERSTLVERYLDESERWNGTRMVYVDRDDAFRRKSATIRILRGTIDAPFSIGSGFAFGALLKGPTTGSGVSQAVAARACASGDAYLYISQDPDVKPWVGSIGSVVAQGPTAAAVTLTGAPEALTPERILDTQLFGVTRRSQAQREARYHLSLAQFCPRFASFECFLGDVDLEPGDHVAITSTRLGYAAKQFTVLSLTIRPDGRCAIDAREYDAQVFTDGFDPLSGSGSFQPGGQVPVGTRSAASDGASSTTPAVASPPPPVVTTPPAAPPTKGASGVTATTTEKKT